MFNHKSIESHGTSLLEFSLIQYEEADSKCRSRQFNALSPELRRAVSGILLRQDLKLPQSRARGGQEEDHVTEFWEVLSSAYGDQRLPSFRCRPWLSSPGLVSQSSLSLALATPPRRASPVLIRLARSLSSLDSFSILRLISTQRQAIHLNESGRPGPGLL